MPLGDWFNEKPVTRAFHHCQIQFHFRLMPLSQIIRVCLKLLVSVPDFLCLSQISRVCPTLFVSVPEFLSLSQITCVCLRLSFDLLFLSPSCLLLPSGSLDIPLHHESS